MAIVVILVVLWGVVLTPTVLRRFKGSEGHQSIDSFHHSLHLLERSGPKIVQPAYRLSSPSSISTPTTQPRPRLVLLRPLGQGEEEPMFDRETEVFDDDGERYERYYVESEEPPSFGASLPSESYGRRIAARRRRNILFGLAAAVVVSGLGTMVVGSMIYLLVLSVLALIGYVALMSWAATTGQYSRSAAPSVDRHVARAVVGDTWHDDGYGYDDEFDAAGTGHDVSDDRWADDGWWDEPRRVASR
jgi:hypothetical protein